MIVLNKDGNRKVTRLEYAKNIIVPNAEASDTTDRERLAVMTNELDNSRNTIEIACGASSR